MVRSEKPVAPTYNSVPIGIGVAGKSYVESFLEIDHSCHSVSGRRIHSDLAVPINRHEAEGRIYDLVHNFQVEPIPIADSLPVSHARATQGIYTDANLALTDCLKIDHRREIVDIIVEVLKGMYVGCLPSTFKRYSHHPVQIFGN